MGSPAAAIGRPVRTVMTSENQPIHHSRPGSVTDGAWVVIPAFNEAAVIEGVVREVIEAGYRVIVVDDCSTDDTGARAAAAGALVCRHLVNLGQGAALQTGIDCARARGARFVVTFDADGQHSPGDLPAMLAPLERNECMATLGTRFALGGAALDMPPVRRALLKLATLLTRLSTGLRLTDTHNGLRAFRIEVFDRLRITQNRMAHASEILSEIARLKIPYREVGTAIRYTEYSLAKGQRMRNAFNVLWETVTRHVRS